MHIGWPQGILLVLMFLSTGIHLAKNGEPRDDNYSFTIAAATDAIWMALLWWGGFFGR